MSNIGDGILSDGSENLTLEEFIKLPDTVDFVTWYTPIFEQYISDKPYIRTGVVLSNKIAVMYTSERWMDDIFRDLGFDFMNTYPDVYGLLDREALESAGIISVQNLPYANLRGSGVVIGFIDTGIDYTKSAFCYEDGTSKIISIWDQTVEGTPPTGMHYGTEFTREQINEALQSENPRSVVNHVDSIGHGTFLASIAAGRDEGEYIGAAPDSEIVCVKLRRAHDYYLHKFLVPENKEDAYLSSDILQAIKYILDTATSMGRPCVFCIALGTNFGAHDGSSKLETYISYLSERAGVIFCCAGGNEGMSRHHTQGRIANTGDVHTINIQVGDNGESFSTYIWYPSWDRISVSIRTPTGELINRVPFEIGINYQRKLTLERSSVQLLYHQDGYKFAIVQIIDPTPGIWQVMLHADSIISGDYHVWLPMTGFVSPGVELLSPTPDYTVVLPATAWGAIAVNAYDIRNDSLYTGNSWGPSTAGKVEPDLAAPGVNVGGIYPSGPGTMTGTSVAAAITAGASALLLQWGIVQGNEVSMNGNRLRALLIRGCRRDNNYTYPNTQWGYGKLDLMRSLSMIREE